MSVNLRSAELVHNPLFRQGYGEIWRALEPCVNSLWQDEDLASYKRGCEFGLYVLAEERTWVPLLKHNYIHPRCLELLVCAWREGALSL